MQAFFFALFDPHFVSPVLVGDLLSKPIQRGGLKVFFLALLGLQTASSQLF